jgi:predicted flap endonuclease-1-like 5' DNA nuclease
MNYPIEEIEGIGPTFGEKLKAAGVKDTGDLLKNCCDPKGRKGLAETTGIPYDNLLKWTNRADLMRINGVGKQFSELLENAGVDTVKELGTRRADNLTKKMEEVNAEKKLARTNPKESQVMEWVAQAKTMDAIITH